MTDDDTTVNEPAGENDLRDRQYGIYQCNDCENVVLTLQDCDGGMTCHGQVMERVTDVNIDIQPPDVKQVLLDAFGLPKPGLDICLCVIGEGPMPPADVAEYLDYDETTVRRYLNRLVDIGLLEKSQLNREGGGFVNVYHSIDVAEMRRDTLIGFYAWAGEAAALIEEANLTKEEYLDEDYSEGLNDIFWEKFESGS
ncbi:helix-turn-helix domain-containing protein [Halorientalis regularis]|jgi:predicted transcriptional regulator|uniref:Predicted transcriptional regulator n=1 Tax=Halorientalis regularis TaxID=660518 RepID=A0A1G7R745_9EURY|nr:helix-turn-helix domain-containing protein [Halorientalis regularis]SDG06524.1 Predicted transcriptional regulator [Halorientalis regularis]